MPNLNYVLASSTDFRHVPSVAIADLTGAFGTTGDAITVHGAVDQTNLNNNFRRVEDKINAALAALRAGGRLAGSSPVLTFNTTTYGYSRGTSTVADLSGATGTVDGTMQNSGITAAALNNNFAELSAKVNAILARLRERAYLPGTHQIAASDYDQAQLIDSTTGTPAAGIVDVTGTPATGPCNNNMATLTTRVNQLLAVLF